MARGALIRSAGQRGQLWAGISHLRESEKERKTRLKSRKAFEEKSALGRFLGGTGGALFTNVLLNMIAPGLGTVATAGLTAAGVGVGSRGGQELAVGLSEEARKRPGIGIWDVEAGREERGAEDIYRRGAMGARSFQDLQTAFWTALAVGQLPGLGGEGKTFPIQPGKESARMKSLRQMLQFETPSMPGAPFAGAPSLQRRGLIQNLRMR